MIGVRRAVVIAGLALPVVWIIANWQRIVSDTEGTVSLVIGVFFALLIGLRWKRVNDSSHPYLRRLVLPLGLFSFLLGLSGIIFNVHQFEWLGILGMSSACFLWGLPERYSRDVLLALFLLYWVHPLPGQLTTRLEFSMQRLSVLGAEWLLHCFNFSAWADAGNMILHSGARSFGVPEACSGLRTATVVFLSVLGVSVVFKFRWFETIVFILLGIIQVIALNVIRIFAMAVWARRMPVEWGQTFLHDTLGIFLLLSILIVHIESIWWRAFTTQRRNHMLAVEKGVAEPPDRASPLPIFWRVISRWGWLILLCMAIASAVVYAIIKRQPKHRARMIATEAEALLPHDPSSAERAINASLLIMPRETQRILTRARARAGLNRYTEALDDIVKFEKLQDGLPTGDIVLKAMVLQRLGKTDDAISLLNTIPEQDKTLPGVAIVAAECASVKDNVDEVVRNVLIASKWHGTLERVRMLFPYLALKNRWCTIAECDSHVLPYKDITQALIAINAHLKMRDYRSASQSLRRTLEKWQSEPCLLGVLFDIAIVQPDAGWEKTIETIIETNLHKLDSDHLATYMARCFAINRPDMSWRIFKQLHKLDPNDPALWLTAARFGDVWFTIRRKDWQLESSIPNETIDLRPFYLLTRESPFFSSFWKHVPLCSELGSGDIEKLKQKYLTKCLTELENRRKNGKISERMELMFPMVYMMLGRDNDAERFLDDIASKYPAKQDGVLFQKATLYDRAGRWDESYECLRKLQQYGELPGTPSDLMMVNAMLNLDMAVSALDIAEQSKASSPDAIEPLIMKAAVFCAYGFLDHALFLLSSRAELVQSRTVIRLLLETGRIQEALKIAQSANISLPPPKQRRSQVLVLPPAESAVQFTTPTSVDMMRHRQIKSNLSKSKSPFITALYSSEIAWDGNSSVDSQIKHWERIGRDEREKASALHRLALLLAQSGKPEQAKIVVEKALSYIPRSAILWRLMIALSHGDANIVEKARQICPDDPEIWLAWLVVQTQTAETSERDSSTLSARILLEIRHVVAKKKFAPETFVRAGDLLLRRNFVEPACVLARAAVAEGRGLLPAYVLAIRCALTMCDFEQAVKNAMNAIEHATDPTLFYKVVADIRLLENKVDANMIEALYQLKERFPDDPKWQERLGYVHFQRGDFKKALEILGPIIDRKSAILTATTFLSAAESARREGNTFKAVNILEIAYARYPDRLSILNNLAYYLAENTGTVARATQLLPQLLELGKDRFEVLDTAAVICLRAGKLELAQMYSEKALELLDEKHYSALETKLNFAEIKLRRGAKAEARKIIESIIVHRDASEIVRQKAARLLAEIQDSKKNKM